LSRLLLGIDGSPVRLWSDEPLMGRLHQRLCPAREDRLGEPIGQSNWRACLHCLGRMDCFWLAKLTPPNSLQGHRAPPAITRTPLLAALFFEVFANY
jgi:hypothetical protein